jgi:DNA ligase 1
MHMQIDELADTLEQVESASRLARVTTLLANAFAKAGEDVAIVVYLLQGRLGPPYAAPDLGIDERRMAEAIARAADMDIAAIRERDRELGDLGDVAARYLPSGRPLSVSEAHQRLREIAATSGAGSTQRKVEHLAALLRQAGGPAARYLVRIVLGRLRVQVGDATVMSALSVAAGGASVLRPDIERAYHYCADLGVVAQALLTDGADALAHIHPAPGRPVLAALAERLPDAQAIVSKLGTVLVEPKYDGLRLQVQKAGERVWLFTRRLEDVTASFPEIVQAALQQIVSHQAILDGEAVSFDPDTGRLLPFQETMRRRRKRHIAGLLQSIPMCYYAFDLLLLDSRDLTASPQRERSARLRSVLRDAPQATLHITPQLETDDPQALQRYFDAQIAAGMEGVVVKRPDAPYPAGSRGFDWVKLKREYQTALADTFDLAVVGYDRGRGKRTQLGIGSLLCAVYDPQHDRFRTVARLGTGLSEAEWVRLRQLLDAERVETRPLRVDARIVPDVWVEPHYVLEVIAGAITRSPLHTAGTDGGATGYALRFPRMVAFRFDRRAEDATTEAEVVELFNLQRHPGHSGQAALPEHSEHPRHAARSIRQTEARPS